MTHSKIEIANPVVGGQRYTSSRRAADFIRRGLAVIDGDKLWFVERAQNFTDRVANREFAERRGMIWWNGSEPEGTFRPGQVRS